MAGEVPREVKNLRRVEVNVEDRERESPPGGWMLKLEPVPLVVRDEAGGAAGQGSELLGQGPGVAIEVPEWLPPFGPEGGWASAGGEIPDQVELPELEEPAGPGQPN